VADRFLGYPNRYQEYLHREYGLPKYHPKHLARLEAAGKRPKPVEISPRRRAMLQSAADAVGREFLTKAQNAAALSAEGRIS
jgi:hypothetical protein